MTGSLVVTTTDTLMPLVARAVPNFLAAHPDLTVTCLIGNEMADMSRHEADVAIRPTRTPPETLVGRRLGGFDFAIYRSPAGGDGWIGFDDSLSDVPSARWLTERMDGAPRLRVNSLWAAAQAVEAGLGRGVLPSYLAQGRELDRVGDPIAALRSEVWMLYHPDLRRAPRVRLFAAAVAPVLAALL